MGDRFEDISNYLRMSSQEEDRIGPTLRALPGNRVIRLDNVSCAYCGTGLAEGASSKEHVIGRRLVPKGKLAGRWNLIVNACRPCNVTKSDLEDDTSAITMLPDIFGRYVHADAAGALEASRKARELESLEKYLMDFSDIN